jgi:hypothetical protein
MDTKNSIDGLMKLDSVRVLQLAAFQRRFKMRTKIRLALFILTIAALLVLPFVAYAAPPSPFIGNWQAIDVDGSDIRLTIAGPPSGPFQITWTESYLSFCNGEAGIGRGTGMLNEEDASLLEAELHVECFTTGASTDAHLALRYHPATDTLSARYENGMVVIWHRSGRLPLSPTLDLRVNYGHDWVESFYEAGHMVWITVTESDGMTVKATAELVTEPKDFWDGETGFQTQPEDWDPAPPDIQPYDWVFGWVDNGASAQLQIGDIIGRIDLEADSIDGTITAPWFSDEVNVECHPWGAPEPQPEMKFDIVQLDGEDTYSCSWTGDWDIQLGQDVGVGYFGPDGHWVANAFYTNARIIASANGDWLWTTDFTPWASLTISIYESEDPGAALLWKGSKSADETGFLIVDSSDHSLDLVPGNYLTVSDEVVEKRLVLESITLDIFDVEQDFMAGTAPPGRDVWVAAGPQEYQIGMSVTADPETGAWEADFNTIPFDITEEMRIWSYAQIFDDDGDLNEADPPLPPPTPSFTAFLEQDVVEGWGWPEGEVHLAIDDPDTEASPDFEKDAIVVVAPWDPDTTWLWIDFASAYDLGPDDVVTLTDDITTQTHVVRNLAITAVDAEAGTVAGTADVGAMVHAWVHGFDESQLQLIVEDSTWLADFSSLDFDLQEGMCGRAEIRDGEGNSTAVDWCVPNPWFTAFPEQEVVEGWDWPLGTSVHLTINDPDTDPSPEYEQTEVVVLAPWEFGGPWVWFDFAGAYNMKAGDVVTLTDGITERTHVVQNLSITAVDPEENTVAGTSDSGKDVRLWSWEAPPDKQMQVTADDLGSWAADFDDVDFDLVPGYHVRAEIWDEAGNDTAVDWSVPPPPSLLVQISEVRPSEIINGQP